MYNVIKPLLFKLDPESAHNLVSTSLKLTQKIPGFIPLISSFYSYPSSRFYQKIWDLDFPNPIGLAAGFDKNAKIPDAMAALGFGFLELGSVTYQPCSGNDKPRLFRLEKDRALINRMGLNNEGPYRFIENYTSSKISIPNLVSISKTNDPSLSGVDAISDFCQCYKLLGPYLKIVVFNLSCPNTKDGKTFETEEALSSLLDSLLEIKAKEEFSNKILVKFSSDVTVEMLLKLVDISRVKGVDGFVLCNTSNSRGDLETDTQALESIGRGGLSGKPIYQRSISRISAVYKHTSGALPIIGLGGVDSSESAINMIKAGASLVEVYTGLVYEGPGLVKSILEGLERELISLGALSVREIIGSLEDTHLI